MSSLIIAWFAAHQRERGATAVEYALLVSLIAAVIVAIVTTLGLQVGQLYEITFGAIP